MTGDEMRLVELFGEAWRAMVAAKVASAMVAFLCVAMCVISITTVGRTVFAEAQLEQRMEDAGSRVVTVNSTKPGVVRAGMLETMDSLTQVTQAVGRVKTIDAVSASAKGGASVPTLFLVATPDAVINLVSGRLPLEGEAVVTAEAMDTLGMDSAVGALMDRDGLTYSVVGQYTPKEPFDEHNQAIIFGEFSHNLSLQSMTVVGASSQAMPAIEKQFIQVVSPLDGSDITVDSAVSMAQLQEVLRSDFGDYSRSLLLLILIGGGLLMGVVVLADTLMHRKDFGRRRALGVTRSELTLLVTLRTLFAASIGVVVGVIAAFVVNSQTGISLPFNFVSAISLLVLLCCMAFSSVPALFAAYRDPVSVLRTV